MKFEEVRSCPVCQGTHFESTLTCTDHTASHEVFHVKHCLGCGLGITSPRPVETEASHYYESDQYISHTSASRTLFDSIYLIIRAFTTRWKYRLVKPYLRTHGLLDYGCGTGSFLDAVKKHHPNILGVEPSAIARTKVDPDIVVHGTLNELPPQAFDVITLWHVLEHVYSLRETLRALKDRLPDGGILFVAVPNHKSSDAKHYGQHWAAYDVPRHLWHFSRESMATFLHQEGLRIVQILPMKLDAYYVSLLSERYAHPGTPGPIRLVRALWVAMRSNLAARRLTNHSSLIFVAQK